MSHILPPLSASFLPSLLAGMARDFEMAGMALGMGLLFGVPLALVWAMRSPVRVVPNAIVQLLRAAPFSATMAAE
jgi:ABC-type arginine/histidine transport system permease subunit